MPRMIRPSASPRHPRNPRLYYLDFDLLSRGHVDLLAFLRARALEVDQTVDTPYRDDGEGNVGFMPAHSTHHERADQVEQHTHQIRRHSEEGNKHVLESAESVMFTECHDGDNARHHVQQECAEITDERHDDGALRDFSREIMTPEAEAVPNIVRQRLDHIVRLGAGTGEIEQ